MTTSRRRWRWSLRKRRARRGNCSRTKMSRPAGAGAGAWPLPAYYSCSTYWSKQQEDQEPAGPSFRPLAKAALGHHHRPGQSEHHQTAPYHPWRRFSPRIPAAVCQRQPRWLMGGCVPLLAAFADVLVLLTSVFQWIGSSSPLFLLFPYSVVSWALWILSYRSASISLVTGGGWSPPECSFHSGTASFRTRLKSVTSSSRPPSRTGQEARERNVWCNWWRWWLFQQQHRLSASGSCSCDVTPLLRSTVSATHRASFSKGLHEVVALRPEAAPSSVQQPTCYRSPKRSPPLSSPSSPSTSSCCFLAVVLLVGSLSPAVVSTPAGLTAESLNPWLKADGGLILRVVTGSSSLDWVRPNPGACQPRPTVPPCPSDRYCPTRSAAEISSASGGFSNRPSSPFVFSPTGHRSPSSSSSDTMGVSVPSANTSQCLPYLHSTGRSKSSGGGGGGSVGGGGGGPSPAECICGHADGAKRIDALRKYHLHHCYHYNLWHVLSDTKREGITRSRSQCYANLEEVERLDSLAAHFVCQFEDILRRYDCAQTFSSKSSCQRCKVAYRQWACSMVLPMWLDGEQIRPCRSFCHEVERLCPYFLPAEKTGPGSQYAGEPSFLCIDPDVRETTNQSANSAYNDRSCYRPCTLDYSLEPDIDPSVCVSSLTGASGAEETSLVTERTDSDCQQGKNETTTSVEYEDGQQHQCPSPSKASSDLDLEDPTRRVSSSAWTSRLCFGWRTRWRTSVLPHYALLCPLFLLHFFISIT